MEFPLRRIWTEALCCNLVASWTQKQFFPYRNQTPCDQGKPLQHASNSLKLFCSKKTSSPHKHTTCCHLGYLSRLVWFKMSLQTVIAAAYLILNERKRLKKKNVTQHLFVGWYIKKWLCFHRLVAYQIKYQSF